MKINDQEFTVTGPFYNGVEAAKYTGYSCDHFRHLASEHRIPRFGPRNSRYSQAILDTWMANPNCFIIKALPKRRTLMKVEV